MSLGANLHLLAGVLGLLLVALMTLLLAFDVLSPDHLLLYSLCWMVPGWMVTERARFL